MAADSPRLLEALAAPFGTYVGTAVCRAVPGPASVEALAPDLLCAVGKTEALTHRGRLGLELVELWLGAYELRSLFVTGADALAAEVWRGLCALGERVGFEVVYVSAEPTRWVDELGDVVAPRAHIYLRVDPDSAPVQAPIGTVLPEVHFSKLDSGPGECGRTICFATLRSNVKSSTDAGAGTSVCALDGCDVAVLQPAGGGRRRLYCSNAHRAEARRRRLVEAPDPAPGDVVGATVVRLASVLDDLRGFEATLRAVDPGLQSLELARVRAEATAEVLAAQQASAKSAEEAARSSERLATERAGWERERTTLAEEIEGLRSTAATARERAASTADTSSASPLTSRVRMTFVIPRVK